ncbi:MAG: PKD-like domain-containing protein [Bacteroidota bacterium]
MKNTTTKYGVLGYKWLFRLVIAIIFSCSFQSIKAQCTAPIATASPASQTICSGSAPSIVLQSDIVGTTFALTVVETAVSGALGGNYSIIQDTLNTTGVVTGTAVYTIYPTANGCSGASITVSITVNPAPIATATPPAQTFCSGGTTSIALSSNVTSATFSWTVVQTNVTGATVGTGNSIAQTLNVPGTTSGTAVYSITPTTSSCAGTPISVTVTVNPLDDASFTYSSATYCQTGNNPSPNLTGLSGGTYSATPAGLIINPSTGVISLVTSALGTYTVTYATNGTCPNTSSVTITITNAPSANFSYFYSAYCLDASNPSPVFGSGASAGTFSCTPLGMVIANVNTGEIGMSGSTPGIYTVTNTIPANGGCAATIATTTITLLTLDNASFIYSSPIYCQTETNPTPTITGVSGGFFSSIQTGLSIDSLTGTINISTSALGTFTVSYTTNSTCPNSSFLNITITNAVWPGDADNDSLVNNNDLLTVGLFYGQTGLARASVSNVWQAHSSANWGILESNGADIKNADCNGDGTIDANDTLAINLNFSLTHLLPTINNYNNERLTAPDIYLSVVGISYNAGDWVEAALWLGSSTSPLNNLYGIAFNINYTSSLVQSGTENIVYTDSWLGTPGTDVIKISKADAFANVAYGAETRIDHSNANGFGKIADFKFQVNTSLNSAADINLSISNYLAVDNTGATIVLNPLPTLIYVVGIDEQNINSEITIAPNPFNYQTIISFNEEQKHSTLKITDILGKEVRSINFSGKQLIIEKGEMQPGIYFVKIFDGKKIYDKKIVVQ